MLRKQYQGDENGLGMSFSWRKEKFVFMRSTSLIIIFAELGDRRIILYIHSCGSLQKYRKTQSNRNFKDD
jgi:hypothetical protein